MKFRSTKDSRTTSENLLDELQATLAHGPVARRVEALRRVTELFVTGAADYSEEQVGLFDDVFQCLVGHIETAARALLAERLAPVVTAPPGTIRRLALDDAIEVAGPVLSNSERLDEATLIEIARSKSQAHLKAISLRRMLSNALTDVLVMRGNDEVVQSTVKNAGAQLSEDSLSQLVDRAERDDGLAACIGLRPDLPRHHYLKLVAKASLAVRRKLEAANPGKAGEVADIVQEAAQRARAMAVTRQTEMARALVKSLFEDGRLNEHQVAAFAEKHKLKRGDLGDKARIELVQNPDLLAELGKTRGTKTTPLLVGFAAETDDVVANAHDKLRRKRLDLIVANDVSAPGVGFQHDTNAVTLIRAAGSVTSVSLTDKRAIARAILDSVCEIRLGTGDLD